jgi:hypothetical protein
MVFGTVLEYSGLSLSLLPGAPGGEVTDAYVISQRDCLMMFLLVGDAFSRGMMRWMVYPTCCTGLRLTASHRGDRAYL